MANEILQRDISKLRDSISSILDNFIPTRYMENSSDETQSQQTWTPDVDIKETKDDFILYVSLPGVKKENVETEIKDNLLTISGKIENKEEEDNWLRKEIPYGHFYRAFKIGARVKTDSVKAHLKDGILEIRIPKADEAKPNKIQID